MARDRSHHRGGGARHVAVPEIGRRLREGPEGGRGARSVEVRGGGWGGPAKAAGRVGPGLTARFPTRVSCVIVPSFPLAEPSAWHVWQVSPFSQSEASRKIARPWATSWSFDVCDVAAAVALRIRFCSPLASLILPCSVL